MKKKFLEDIVKEDLVRETSLSKRIGNKIKYISDSPFIKHPVITSGLVLIGSEYLRQRYPELGLDARLNVLSSYTLYHVFGLMKEYILEGRKFSAKGIYNWFLQNPKIAALGSTVLCGAVTYYGESNMSHLVKEQVPDFTIAHAMKGGILTEVIIRCLNNSRKIKRSVNKTTHSVAEKIYNSAPAVLTGLTFVYYFLKNYSARIGFNYPENKFLSGNLINDIINHPGGVASTALVSGLESAVVFGGALVLSAALHPRTLKEGYYKIAKTASTLAGNKPLELQKKIVSLQGSVEGTIEELVEFGNMYYETGDEKDKRNAFICYKKALRLFTKKGDQISYADFFRRSLKLNKLRRGIKKIKHRKDCEESSINRVFIGLLNKDASVVEDIKTAVEANPDDPNLTYMYGKVLEVLGFRESGRLQKVKAISLAMKKDDTLETRVDSKNPIIRFRNEFLDEDLIAKFASIQELAGEIRTTRRVREIIKDFANYDVPVPLGIVEISGRNCYVMEMASGDLLIDIIKGGKAKAEDFYAVADFMGLVHARLDPATKYERDAVENIKERLRSVHVPERLVKEVSFNLRQISDCLEPIERVYNKDGDPRNWKIDKFGGIVALDLEEGRIVPLTFDTANLLLGQHKNLGEKERDAVVRKHFDSFTRYSGKKININNYKLAYLNSIVIRTLEIYSQVRTKNREVMFDSLENAEIAIRKVEEVFPEYYKERKGSYKVLSDVLEELKTI